MSTGVTVSYDNTIIHQMAGNGSFKMNTDGSYMEGDVDVVVDVPNTYEASDEGKVVDSGALVAQTSQTVTQNGTYDTTLKNEVVVDVEGGEGGVKPFIESQGTAYFDTQVAGNTIYGIHLEFIPITMVNAYQWYAGAANNNFTFAGMSVNDGVTSGFIRIANTDLGVISLLKGKVNTLECSEGTVTLNGTVIGSYSGAINTDGTTLRLLGDSTSSRLSHARIYKCVLYDSNGDVLRNYVPRLDSNYIPCLYDSVTDTYLYGNNNKLTYGSGNVYIPKTITQNGTYDPADDNVDGYSEVTVNVSGGGGSDWGVASSVLTSGNHNIVIKSMEVV